jgi:uroporphyrinogen-III synthase
VKALVTRPSEDAGTVVAALASRGIEAVLEPLLAIRFAADGATVLAPLLAQAQAVLFTSANGVRAFAAAATRRDLPAFAVGAATAAAARHAGFGTVAGADGDVAGLARLVQQRLAPADGTLVHAAGRAVAGDLAAALGAAGFDSRRAVLYDAVSATALSPATADLLAAGGIALALFFSPRTALSFARLARAAGLEEACHAMTAIALSPGVAAALDGLAWGAVRSAAAPTAAALFAALDRALAERATQPAGMGQDVA